MMQLSRRLFMIGAGTAAASVPSFLRATDLPRVIIPKELRPVPLVRPSDLWMKVNAMRGGTYVFDVLGCRGIVAHILEGGDEYEFRVNERGMPYVFRGRGPVEILNMGADDACRRAINNALGHPDYRPDTLVWETQNQRIDGRFGEGLARAAEGDRRNDGPSGSQPTGPQFKIRGT